MVLRQDMVRRRAGAKPVLAEPVLEQPSASPPLLRRLARLQESDIRAAEQDDTDDADAKTLIFGEPSPRSGLGDEAGEDAEAGQDAEVPGSESQGVAVPEMPESFWRVDQASRFQLPFKDVDEGLRSNACHGISCLNDFNLSGGTLHGRQLG